MKNVIWMMFLVVVVVGLGSAPTDGASVLWSEGNGGNGHWYEAVYVGPGGISWDTARTTALAAGRDLVTVNSAEENDFVFGLVGGDARFWFNITTPASNRFTFGPWLGGFQPDGSAEPAGNWRWVSYPAEAFTYLNWASGQPNDWSITGENQNALHFLGLDHDNPESLWNDLDGVTPEYPITGYIVEYVPELATLLLLTLGALALVRRRKRGMCK